MAKKIDLPSSRLKRLAREWRAKAAGYRDIGIIAEAKKWESAARDCDEIIRSRKITRKKVKLSHINDPNHMRMMRERLRVKRSAVDT